MARHRAAGNGTQNHSTDRSIAAGPLERRSLRSGLDAVPLWTGLLLTVAEAVNQWWFTTFAWFVVAVRSAMAVHSARPAGRRRERRPARTRFGSSVRLFHRTEKSRRDRGSGR